ncbi:MAG: hypothetical protein U0667_04720 [Chloroflexota bacterium]
MASLRNPDLYADLDDPDIPDGLRRVIAAHRYYVDFFVNREGCDFLTFHTNGWACLNPADKVAAQETEYGRWLAARLWDFRNGYPGDPYVDWVTLTAHFVDFWAADWPGLSEDRLVPTESVLGAIDEVMTGVRTAAPGKPVMMIEVGFPDRMVDSKRAAERITAFYEHVERYPEIRAFGHWADSRLWADSWPYDSLIRPGTHQARALRAMIDRDPTRFASVVHLSDGTTFPPAGGRA